MLLFLNQEMGCREITRLVVRVGAFRAVFWSAGEAKMKWYKQTRTYEVWGHDSAV